MNLEQKTIIAENFLDNVLKLFGVEKFEKEVSLEEDLLKIKIKGKGLEFLTEDEGKVLNALQYIVGLVSNNVFDEYLKVVLDCEDFREKRNCYLKELSKVLVEKVLNKKQPVTLEPMNPFERRLVHSYVSEYYGVYSKSVGKDPTRSVVIYPEKN